jgi:ditrans,polycis-polyprenyl diphosphate synthase
LLSTADGRSCILNICFPYTSREEITSAVRSTVQEYSTPPQPHSTTFSQARITQKILSRQDDSPSTLASIREASPEPSSRPSADDVDDSVSSTPTLHPESQSPPFHPGNNSDFAIYPNAETITAATLDRHMYTGDCPPLDMFVRTSGVERLSDFMLWQCHQDTHIFFLKCFWPEFDLWHFLPVLVEWQRRMMKREREEKPRKGAKQQ